MSFNTFNTINPFLTSTTPIISYSSPIMDNLSNQYMVKTTTTKKTGALGVNLLNSLYTGPVMQIKVGSSPNTDFYAPTDGTTGVNVLKTSSGTTLADFISAYGGVTPYVKIWYDQAISGNNDNSICNNATAVGLPGPSFNTTTNEVNFTGGYFSLGDNAFSQGNTSYTYIFRINNVTNQTNGNCMYSGGTASINLYCSGAVNASTSGRRYWNQWSNNDFWYTGWW